MKDSLAFRVIIQYNEAVMHLLLCLDKIDGNVRELTLKVSVVTCVEFIVGIVTKYSNLHAWLYRLS